MLHTSSPSYSWGCHLSEDKPFGHVINLTLYIKYLYYYNTDMRCFICIKSLELRTKRFWLSCPPQAVAPVIIQYSSHNGPEFQLVQKPKWMQHHYSSSASSHRDGLAAPSSLHPLSSSPGMEPQLSFTCSLGQHSSAAGKGGLILAGLGKVGLHRQEFHQEYFLALGCLIIPAVPISTPQATLGRCLPEVTFPTGT